MEWKSPLPPSPRVTQEVIDEVRHWQHRPREARDPIWYGDGLVVNGRENRAR